MPLIEIYFSHFIVLNLFPRSGQFVELPRTRLNTVRSATAVVLYPILLSWIVEPIYFFYLVILNSQILLEFSDISIKLIEFLYVCCGYDLPLDRSVVDLSIYLWYYSAAGIYFSFRWGPFVHSLEIVQWDSTRRDHPGYPRRVSGSGLVSLVSEH